jgi:S-(hydroxymethyl)glutathione dehydrogenase/alcohol dehydrogenase
VIVGAIGPPDQLNVGLWQLLGTEKRLTSSRFGGIDLRRYFPRFVRLAEPGKLDLASMVTEVIPLEASAINDAFAAMLAGATVRTVVRP